MNVMTAAAAGGAVLALAFVFFPQQQPEDGGIDSSGGVAPFVQMCRSQFRDVTQNASRIAANNGKSVHFFQKWMVGAKFDSICACAHDRLSDNHSPSRMALAVKLLGFQFQSTVTGRIKDRDVRKRERRALGRKLSSMISSHGLTKGEMRGMMRDINRALGSCMRG